MKKYDFNTTPIVDIANEIIIDAVKMNASDIHFDPDENYLKIRVRVDGELRDYSIVENKYKRNLITRIKLLSGMNITESRLPQDGAIKSNINGKDLDLRVSCLPTSFGEKIVIRILDYSMSFEGIEALGFTKENYETILQMISNQNGIILVTGATGSGKSTTVYSMLQKLNKEDTNIITVEDPVEMNIEGINQVQVNSDIGLDFATVLRSILRQDPNIILIGEIRDTETAKIAIRASITGHLVLSTLHTNNSLTTIERLLDMDVERYLLSSSLKGIISQNLAKKLCNKCKIKRPTNEMEQKIFQKALNKTVLEIYEPNKKGCNECRNGYKGRIAIQEVLLLNDNIRDAINENIPRSELRDMIYKNDVKTLFQDGLIKVEEGITSFEEVFRIVEVEDDASNIYGYEKETIKTNDKKYNEEQLNIETINDVNINNDKNVNDMTTNKEEKTNNDILNSNYNYENDTNINSDLNEIINYNEPINIGINENDDKEIDDLFKSLDIEQQQNLNDIEETIPQIDIKSNIENEEANQLDNNITTDDSNNSSGSYTEDLINLINQGFFE